MKAAPNVEIRAWLDKLRRNLAELGPVERIKDPDVKAHAGMMQTMLTFVQRNMGAIEPDEDFQRRMIEGARNEWSNLVVARDVVPALKAKQDRSNGGKKASEKNKRKAADRDAHLVAEAKKIRASNSSMSVRDIALRLSERDGLGNVDVIRKKLGRLLAPIPK